jgi:ankyrin repeat protein
MSAGDWKDMFLAACEGDVDLVRHHLATGVDVNFVHPEFQSTALVACILAGHEHMAHFLLDHGADPLLRSDLEDQTPVQAARAAGLTTVETRLRSLGATEPASLIGEEHRARRWWLSRPK